MSQDRPRNESGQFEEIVTEQDILLVFEERSEEPFLTTADVAEGLPISADAVYRRLEKMRENGLVGKKKTGARSVGWWAKVAPRLADDVEERLQKDEDPATSHEGLMAKIDN
jgi:predicted transcriptional regulator